jgi:hypothetical protein
MALMAEIDVPSTSLKLPQHQIPLFDGHLVAPGPILRIGAISFVQLFKPLGNNTMMNAMQMQMPMNANMPMMPMMGMPMPSMKCVMECTMMADGMMCKIMPMAGMNMDMMKNCCTC